MQWPWDRIRQDPNSNSHNPACVDGMGRARMQALKILILFRPGCGLIKQQHPSKTPIAFRQHSGRTLMVLGLQLSKPLAMF